LANVVVRSGAGAVLSALVDALLDD